MPSFRRGHLYVYTYGMHYCATSCASRRSPGRCSAGGGAIVGLDLMGSGGVDSASLRLPAAARPLAQAFGIDRSRRQRPRRGPVWLAGRRAAVASTSTMRPSPAPSSDSDTRVVQQQRRHLERIPGVEGPAEPFMKTPATSPGTGVSLQGRCSRRPSLDQPRWRLRRRSASGPAPREWASVRWRTGIHLAAGRLVVFRSSRRGWR